VTLRAEILAVGSELLTPSRVDTNSLFITEQLNLLGIEVAFKTIVGDDREELANEVRRGLERVDLLVCSGGLGPTDDDVTREVVADVLNRGLVEDERIASRIRARFESRGMKMPDINRRQAMVPVGARLIENTNGTAPGLWIEDGDRTVVLLPGPPRELKPMMASLVEGPLRERAPGLSLVRRVIRITGRTESHTEEAVRPLYAEWAGRPVPIAATILASLGQIELHLSARAASQEVAEAAVEAASRGVSEVIRLTSDSSLDLPEATEDGIKDALLSLEVGHDDQCLVYLTSHGSEDGLYLASEDRLLSPGALAGIVDDGCGDQPTVVIVSACHSGTFLTDEMRQPNRVVLTAARARPTTCSGCSNPSTQYRTSVRLLQLPQKRTR